MKHIKRIRSKPLYWLVLAGLLSITSLSLAQSVTPLTPGIVILEISGQVDYSRPGWTTAQPLHPGTVINASDLVFPSKATLRVLCPDGKLEHFESHQLPANTVIQCTYSVPIIGNRGMTRLDVVRGNPQNPEIPYIISPRATLVRTPTVEIVWNAIAGVSSYQVLLRTDSGVVWESEALSPASVEHEGRASTMLSHPLIPNTPYTIEICVYMSFDTTCTNSNSEWMQSNVEFYYVPDPTINQIVQQIIEIVGNGSALSLYAQAMVLQQTVGPITIDGEPVGYYAEALSLMEEILTTYSSSAIAQSPAFYNQLGELYWKIKLDRSASDTFARSLPAPDDAGTIVTPGTELSAVAALGRAVSSTSGDGETFFHRALSDFAAYLQPAAYAQQYAALCPKLGTWCS